MEATLRLIEESRYLAAQKEYDSIICCPEKCEKYADQINEHRATIDKMLHRCLEVKKSMNLVSSTNEKWILATQYLGVTTHYMIGDDGLLWVRMEATQNDVPVMEQLAVVYEVELFKTWVPFCSESRLVTRLSHTELIAYAQISTPFGICRESVVHAYGVDCIYETGSLVVIGESIDQFEGVVLPPCKGLFNKRASLKFCAVVTPYSPTSGHMIVVSKVDPKLALPQSILNFVTKQLAGFFLVMVYQQAREIASKEDSVYRDIIVENKAFYVDWVLPRVRSYMDHRGWEQPVIACLGEYGLPNLFEKAAISPMTDINAEPDEETGEEEPSARGHSNYIEGILRKKGNAIFYTTWSYRFFELDVCRQKLTWYKCKSGGTKGVKRGEISLDKATASLLTGKQSQTAVSGHEILLIYKKMDRSDISEMVLLAESIEQAYQWISHTNKAAGLYSSEPQTVMSSPFPRFDHKEENDDANNTICGKEKSEELLSVIEANPPPETYASSGKSNVIEEDVQEPIPVPTNYEPVVNARSELFYNNCITFIEELKDAFIFYTPLYPLFLPSYCHTPAFILLLYFIMCYYCSSLAVH